MPIEGATSGSRVSRGGISSDFSSEGEGGGVASFCNFSEKTTGSAGTGSMDFSEGTSGEMLYKVASIASRTRSARMCTSALTIEVVGTGWRTWKGKKGKTLSHRRHPEHKRISSLLTLITPVSNMPLR